MILNVDSIGYLVPRDGFTGRVHSLFAHACNVDTGASLFTIADARAANGPTMLLLGEKTAVDLRAIAKVGDQVACRDSVVRVGRTEIQLARARVWRAQAATRRLSAERVSVHVREAALVLRQWPPARSSVLRGAAAGAVAGLLAGCRHLDGPSASRQAMKLIGWGDGLTPAGDDFLIGLLAAFDTAAIDDPRRLRVREAIAAVMKTSAGRTTPIAAHYSRLAAAGHYNEPLVALRTRLLDEDDWRLVHIALQQLLAIGASSGADTACGLLSGLAAWWPERSTTSGPLAFATPPIHTRPCHA